MVVWTGWCPVISNHVLLESYSNTDVDTKRDYGAG